VYVLLSIINIVEEKKNRSSSYIVIDINDLEIVIEYLFHLLKPDLIEYSIMIVQNRRKEYYYFHDE
jgi:hypothetical protein